MIYQRIHPLDERIKVLLNNEDLSEFKSTISAARQEREETRRRQQRRHAEPADEHRSRKRKAPAPTCRSQSKEARQGGEVINHDFDIRRAQGKLVSYNPQSGHYRDKSVTPHRYRKTN